MLWRVKACRSIVRLVPNECRISNLVRYWEFCVLAAGKCSLFSVKAVTDAFDGNNPDRLFPEFLAEMADVHVHGPRLHIYGIIATPYLFEKYSPCQDSSSGTHEHAQKLKFFGGDLDGFSF